MYFHNLYRMMKKLSYTEILKSRKTIEQFKKNMHYPISVILHNIRSMYNVGTFFRTCDAANINELILTGFTPYPPRNEIEKTALGATDSVAWRYEKNIFDAINKQKLTSKVVAVELTQGGRQYTSLNSDDYPLCLVFGNELTGIDDNVLECCDDAIEIPMYGVKHSLNVGVCGGIVIFEAVRIAGMLEI